MVANLVKARRHEVHLALELFHGGALDELDALGAHQRAKVVCNAVDGEALVVGVAQGDDVAVEADAALRGGVGAHELGVEGVGLRGVG